MARARLTYLAAAFLLASVAVFTVHHLRFIRIMFGVMTLGPPE